MQIIKNQALIDDTWQQVEEGAEVPSTGDVIVSLADFKANKGSLKAREGGLGVRLKSDEGPEDLESDLDSIAVVAIEFPKFADGRGFSYARLLRDRYGYKGEVRAVGDYMRDQLFYMFRCGINAFAMPEQADLEESLNAFKEYSVTYQAAADEGRPLFRRASR